MSKRTDTSEKKRSDQIPLFVERQTYRRRRLVDTARALPALGAVLWLIPLLWAVPDQPTSASSALIYVFVVWVGLPVVAGLLIFLMNKRSLQGGSVQPPEQSHDDA